MSDEKNEFIECYTKDNKSKFNNFSKDKLLEEFKVGLS